MQQRYKKLVQHRYNNWRFCLILYESIFSTNPMFYAISALVDTGKFKNPRTENPCVDGSIPPPATNKKTVVDL